MTKSTTTPTKPDRKIELQLRHTFSDKETLELARKLAEANRDLNQAEDEKKSVVSQLKAKSDAIAARVAEEAGKINCGFEYRMTPCTVKYHTPKTGVKTITRNDLNEVIEEMDMTQAELQDELPLDATKAPEGGVVAVQADGKT